MDRLSRMATIDDQDDVYPEWLVSQQYKHGEISMATGIDSTHDSNSCVNDNVQCFSPMIDLGKVVCKSIL